MNELEEGGTIAVMWMQDFKRPLLFSYSLYSFINQSKAKTRESDSICSMVRDLLEQYCRGNRDWDWYVDVTLQKTAPLTKSTIQNVRESIEKDDREELHTSRVRLSLEGGKNSTLEALNISVIEKELYWVRALFVCIFQALNQVHRFDSFYVFVCIGVVFQRNKTARLSWSVRYPTILYSEVEIMLSQIKLDSSDLWISPNEFLETWRSISWWDGWREYGSNGWSPTGSTCSSSE